MKGRDWVALILAVGVGVCVNAFAFAVLWDAIASAGPGLSDNATQVLVAALGGMIGVLGAYVGGKIAAGDETKGGP